VARPRGCGAPPFFEARIRADRAGCCHLMAERFAAGRAPGSAFGATPAGAPRDAPPRRPSSFVHPVDRRQGAPLAGRSGWPARGGPAGGTGRASRQRARRPIAIAFGGDAETCAALVAGARERGCLTIGYEPDCGAEWGVSSPDVSDDPFIRQEIVETQLPRAVGARAPSSSTIAACLLKGAPRHGPVHDSGASSFLLPVPGPAGARPRGRSSPTSRPSVLMKFRGDRGAAHADRHRGTAGADRGPPAVLRGPL